MWNYIQLLSTWLQNLINSLVHSGLVLLLLLFLFLPKILTPPSVRVRNIVKCKDRKIVPGAHETAVVVASIWPLTD